MINMGYTFEPKQKYAKALGDTLRISPKTAKLICKVIKKKKLTTTKRLLEDLYNEKRSLKGKYYTKTVKEILYTINSCEKNAINQGLDVSKLFVYASAHQSRRMRRRRRKSSYGSLLKSTNLEVFLVEQGKGIIKKKTNDKKTTPKIDTKKTTTEKPQENKTEEKIDTKKIVPKKEEPKTEEKVDKK